MKYRKILLSMVVCMMIIAIYHYSINENVQGQEQQPTNNTDNLETIIQQNQRIIQQNDEAAIQERAGTYIGVIALLISLSLVIYGFQLSREEKVTQKTKRHYRIIILSLVVPVFILIPVAWFTSEEFLYPHYHIMTSLLLIPGLIMIIIIFRNVIAGDTQSTALGNTNNI